MLIVNENKTKMSETLHLFLSCSMIRINWSLHFLIGFVFIFSSLNFNSHTKKIIENKNYKKQISVVCVCVFSVFFPSFFSSPPINAVNLLNYVWFRCFFFFYVLYILCFRCFSLFFFYLDLLAGFCCVKWSIVLWCSPCLNDGIAVTSIRRLFLYL